jgi:hypothetical protein
VRRAPAARLDVSISLECSCVGLLWSVYSLRTCVASGVGQRRETRKLPGGHHMRMVPRASSAPSRRVPWGAGWGAWRGVVVGGEGGDAGPCAARRHGGPWRARRGGVRPSFSPCALSGASGRGLVLPCGRGGRGEARLALGRRSSCAPWRGDLHGGGLRAC